MNTLPLLQRFSRNVVASSLLLATLTGAPLYAGWSVTGGSLTLHGGASFRYDDGLYPPTSGYSYTGHPPTYIAYVFTDPNGNEHSWSGPIGGSPYSSVGASASDDFDMPGTWTVTFWWLNNASYNTWYKTDAISSYQFTIANPTPPPTASLSASPAGMDWRGGSVKLTWSSTDATNVDQTSGFSTDSVNGSAYVSVGPNDNFNAPLTSTYSITVSNSAGSASGSCTVTLDSKQRLDVAFQLDPTTFTYNGGSQGPNIRPSIADATYDVIGRNSATDVGTYSFDVIANGNYQGSAHCDWRIDPKPVNFNFSNLSQTYDGGSKTASVSADDGGATFTSDLTKGPTAGSYTVSATAYGNYSGSGSDTLTINPQGVYCDWGNNPSSYTWTYDGSSHSLWHNTSNNGVVNGSGTDSATDAGSYTYSYSLNDTTDYYFTNSNSQSWTIAPKPISFSFGDLRHSYDGSMKSATVSPSDSSATYNSDLTKGPAPGSYAVSATAYGNYSGTGSDTLIIDAQQATAFSFSPTSFVYDGGSHGPNVSTNPAGATYNTSGTTSATDAGDYSFSISANGNYTGSDTCNWSISPKPVTFSVGGLSSTYNGAPKSISVSPGDPNAAYTVTYTGIAGTSYPTSQTPPTGAGTYSVTTSASGNYSGSRTDTMTIAKATLTVTANNATKLYGSANPSFGYSVSGFVGSDTSAVLSGAPSLSTTATTATGVGTVPIAIAQNTLTAANYSFNFVNGTLTIAKAPLTATANNQTKTYGSANPVLTISYSGFVNGDTASSIVAPTISTTATTSSGVGSYGITLTGGSAANYSITLVNGTLMVTKATLTVTANNQTRTYGSANPPLTYVIAGYVNGDTSAVVSGSASVATPATGSSAVGSYSIVPSAGTLSAANYSFSFVNGTLTITRASLTVTASDQTKAYGAAIPTLTYTVSGFVNGETAAVVSGAAEVTTTATSASGVGAYAITPTIGTMSAANYTFASFVNGTLTVTKVSLTVTANNKSRSYGSANPTFDATYSGFVNGDTSAVLSGTPTFSTPATIASSAGTYAITPAIGTLAAANYTFATFVNGTLTVTKASLTATADNQSKVYGAANPTLTISYSGLVNGDTASSITAPGIATPAIASSPVGSYPISLSGGSAANYTLTLVNGTLTITKASLTAAATNQTRTYGSTNPALTIGYSGFVNGDAASSITAPTASTTATTASAVGSYPITLSGGSATNYTIVLVNGTLTVTPAALTVTANNQSKAYGAANPSLTYMLTGFVNGETTSVVSGAATVTTTATTSSGVGTYTITPAIGTLAAANYTFGTFVNGTLTVTKAALTATADNQSKTYGAPNPTLMISYTGFVNGDNAGSITPPSISTTATTSSPVGSYPITLTGGLAANYTLTLVNGILAVNKATLTATADNLSKVYGAAVPALTITYTGFVNGDTAGSVTAPAVSTTASASSPVGSYPISLSGGSAANYTLTLVNGTLTVSKAPLTATADNQSRVYGSANPTLTIGYAGFVNGDTTGAITTPVAATTATASSAVGSYPITLSGGAATNYTITLVNGTLTITRASLAVTANNQSKTYGAANPSLTYTLAGFVNGDTSSVVSGAAGMTTIATNSSGAGTYAITPAIGTLSATNYSFGPFVNGTLTINKASLTATANNQTRTYGAANPALTISYTGFVNGDTVSSITPPAAGTTAAAASSVGTYAITLSGGSAANYTLSLVNGTLTITQAALIVTANNQSKTYGTANPSLTYTLSGFVNGDTSAVVSGTAAVTTTATTSSGVGTYAITPAAGTLSATNYTFGPFVNGTLAIDKALLTATANDQSRAYGTANPTLTISYSGFVNGDTASSIAIPTASTTAITASSVGTYPIALSGGSASNYTLSLVNGVLTVTPATLTVSANNQTRTYGATNPTLTYSFSGFVNGDTSAVVSGAPSLSTTATSSSGVGTYAIAVAPGSLVATNYQFGLVNGTLAIVPKPVTFAFSNLAYTYDGVAKTATATASDSAATFTADLTKGPSAGSYLVSATATGNYSGSGSATLTIAAKNVTFTFGNLSHIYDGTQKTATVTCSDAGATFMADLTKGPDANTYVVSATATGNYSGSGSDNLVISSAAQTITLSPGTATVFIGQPATFTAAGGQNAYIWGGNAGASGSAANVTLSFGVTGNYTLTVANASSVNYLQSNTATATIQVVSNHQVNSLTPIESSYTINDSSSPMNGQTYGRIWQSGGWTAYLGRSGVRFEVTGQAWPSVKTIELQAKAPGGDWTQLATQNPTDTATTADVTFSVTLGDTAPGQPLVPLSYQQGSPQTGQWLFRARVQDASGAWSEYSSEVPVQVILPMVTKTVSGQTVPPAGELGNWFTASAVQDFSLQLWVP